MPTLCRGRQFVALGADVHVTEVDITMVLAATSATCLTCWPGSLVDSSAKRREPGDLSCAAGGFQITDRR